MKNGIILCSGGVDSVITAHYTKKELGYDSLIILFFNYLQKSLRKEREASRNCAKELKAKFIEIRLPSISVISPSLINRVGKVNKLKREDLKDTRKESINWYVPFRNAIFLSHALGLAESIFLKKKEKCDLFVGFKYEGVGGFPDASLKFLNVMEKVGEFGQKKFKIKAPLIKKDKSEVINVGKKLDVDFKKTFSCYIGKNKHCGYCLACKLRQEAFYWANTEDPTSYLKK